MAPSLGHVRAILAAQHVVCTRRAAPAGTVGDVPTNPRKRRRTIVLAVVATLVAAGAFAVVSSIKPLLETSGCQAGTGQQALSLDTQQAAIAATIAGVAHQQALPSRAVTVAYAAAMQESKLHNLGYGDRDSVGVFQQRPSEGWGPASKLRDPVYATTKFFNALTRVQGYQSKPVYQAAQAVQRSADGYAYVQYQPEAAKLTTYFTGKAPHAVWCWSATPVTGDADIAPARAALRSTFGSLGQGRVTTLGDPSSLQLRPSDPAVGWAVASWLVTHAARYHIHSVRYGGFEWRESAGTSGWTHDENPAATGDIRAS
jgi:hypothetical protein